LLFGLFGGLLLWGIIVFLITRMLG